jgi:hypothetical protein
LQNRSQALRQTHASIWSLISTLAASVILAVLVQAYAGATLRGLYADGAYVVTRLAIHQSLVNPARWIATMIAQWPVVAAMGLGVQSPHDIALVFSLATNLLPGLIILLCLPVLPTGKRHFFIFPKVRADSRATFGIVGTSRPGSLVVIYESVTVAQTKRVRTCLAIT